MFDSLTAISPLDGRYHRTVAPLEAFWSEHAYMRYRLHVEVEYLIELSKVPQIKIATVSTPDQAMLRHIVEDFNLMQAKRVKEIEATTNHDVKAIEYYLRQRIFEMGLPQAESLAPFIHFGLTSQDVNNTALPLMLRHSLERVLRRSLAKLVQQLEFLAARNSKRPMLARTHGQPASPTTLGKEIYVFVERLQRQIHSLNELSFPAKFGGATGNFNAHYAAYPDVDWVAFANRFVEQSLGLQRNQTTTQIDHYDGLAAIFDNLRRINVILLDLTRDCWQYIAFDYFKLELKEGEIGSSTMPHKVNPIDFENAEGNLGLANAIFDFLSNKLPVSRLQRDLSDSTVARNIGLPLAYSLVAYESLIKGIGKLTVNDEALERDLEANWQVLAEAVQTLLRREGFDQAYEELKNLTRTGRALDKSQLHAWIAQQNFPQGLTSELLRLTPQNYIGNA